MIKIIDYKGREHHVSASAVAHIYETGPSSQWHGIRCCVKLHDGTVIEAGDDMSRVVAAIEKEQSDAG